MGRSKRNFIAFYNQTKDVFGNRFFQAGSSTQYIIWLLVLSLCHNNASAFQDSDPRVKRSTPTMLELKVNAAQTDVDRLISALAITPNQPAHALTTKKQYGIGFSQLTSSNKVIKLENEMKKMKGAIDQLLQSVSITTEDRERLSGLENSVKKLQNLMDAQRRELEQNIYKLDSLVDILMSTINSLRTELDDLTHKAMLQVKEGRLRELPMECIEAIKSHDFTTAKSKLQEIAKDSTVNMIVNSVYDHHESNFDVLLRFAEAVNVKQRSFLVYKALGYEMEINGHKDPLKIIELIHSLRKVIIYNQIAPAETRRNAQIFEENLKNVIKIVSKEKLKHALLNKVYGSNDIRILSNSVFGISYQLFGSLITEVVNDVYGRIDTKYLLQSVNSHSYYQQSILGNAAVFKKIKGTNDGALFNLAYHIKDAFNCTCLDSESISTLYQIKNALPKSVRNTAFATTVCIENTLYPKNLFASGRYLHDESRRMVFTWMPNYRRDDWYKEDRWNLIRTGESFYIFNVAHKEYMYSPNDYKDFLDGEDRRKVFTWAGGEKFSTSKWNLEPVGDNVHIKNDRSEYLYTSNSYKHEMVNQKVFTWIPGNTVSNGLWTIVDCSNA